jgi:hypothetical protein
MHFFLLDLLGRHKQKPDEEQQLLSGNNKNVDNKIIKFACLVDGV